MSDKTAALAVTPHPLGKPGGPGLFHDRGLHLPAYVQNIAADLMQKRGMAKSKAIQVAIGVCQKWASGRGNVHPEVRAAARGAIAEWEAAKAKARATPNKTELSNHFDPGQLRDPIGRWALSAGSELKYTRSEKADETDYERLSEYSSDGRSVEISPMLRGEELPYTEPDDAEGMQTLHDTVASMDRIAESHTLDKPVSVYRIAPAEHYGVADGAEVGDPAFMSTTVHRAVLDKYRTGADDVRMRIDLPVGHRVIPHADLNRYASAKGEVILPRGTRLAKKGTLEDGTVVFHPVTSVGGVRSSDLGLSRPLGARGSAVELATPQKGADAGARPASSGKQAPPKRTPPKKLRQGKATKSGEQQQSKHQLPPGAVGWKHNWVPVDSSGNPVGPSQKDKSAQQIKDMAGHDSATRDAIASAYQNKATADGKKAAAKAKSAAKTAANKAAAAKARAARKAVADKARADRKAVSDKARAAAGHRQLLSSAVRQAQADQKAGRALTATQKRLLAAAKAASDRRAEELRHVSLSQPVDLAVSPVLGSETVSSHDGPRAVVNTLLTKYPAKKLRTAVGKARRDRRKKGRM